MAPVTQSDRYGESIDFWRSVYGIDSKYMLKLCISVFVICCLVFKCVPLDLLFVVVS